ncbi:uncharacterized protein LOC106654460 [Trichogramma pretiosum]|uniref:uncharacterized protein LOC106654460 n=1 Tax=Trichogramma pretiosum TaxID=7493 RepID=UPI0006C97B0C|nr:uncharacterized protein LOC106654460 [Trichogramma pretiosum]
MSLIHNNFGMFEEKPDLKSLDLGQFLPLLSENSTHALRKCDVKLESELDNELEIVVECNDVKPEMDLLAIEKIENVSPNYLQKIKYNDGCKSQNIIKIENTSEVKEEIIDGIAENRI